jgi:hypothetical protein
MTKSLHELVASCLPADNWRFTLMKEWPTIFGPFSNRVSFETVHEDTMVLGVADACLMQELYLLSPLIVSTIQKTIGTLHIKKVRLKRIDSVTHQKQRNPMKKSRIPKSVSLTRAELHALECITDAELKEALRSYCIRCHQERE